MAAEEDLRQQKGPWAVLSELQRQQVTIARLELVPSPCPLCRFPLNVPVARMAYEELLGTVSEIKDEHHACPRCGVQLVFRVPGRAKAIQAAAAAKWPFVEWSEAEGQITAYAEGQLFGGQNEQQFAAELTLAVWQANGAYCKVSVSTTCLEELPRTTHSLSEEEYAGWQSDQAAEQPEAASEIQEVSQDSSAAVNLGPLRIDVGLLATQRRLLTEITAVAREYKPYLPAAGDAGLLEGLLELTEAIADAAEAKLKELGYVEPQAPDV